MEEQARKANILCQIYGLDQGIRNYTLGNLPKGFNSRIDSLSFERAINYIKEYGYPRMKDFGPYAKLECVQASIFAVLLHSPIKIAKNKKNLELLKNEVENGNMNPEVIAIVMDKYLKAQEIFYPDSPGTGVLYSNSFGKPCLKYQKKSDSARAEIGLPPLKTEEFKICN